MGKFLTMKELLNRLINQESISSEEARNVLVNISKGVTFSVIGISLFLISSIHMSFHNFSLKWELKGPM